MSTDLHTQIHDYAGYFGSTLPDIDLEDILTQRVAPQRLPRLKPLEPRRRRSGWVYGLAAAVITLILGLVVLGLIDDQPDVIQPAPTSVPTTQLPSTTTTQLPSSAPELPPPTIPPGERSFTATYRVATLAEVGEVERVYTLRYQDETTWRLDLVADGDERNVGNFDLASDGVLYRYNVFLNDWTTESYDPDPIQDAVSNFLLPFDAVDIAGREVLGPGDGRSNVDCEEIGADMLFDRDTVVYRCTRTVEGNTQALDTWVDSETGLLLRQQDLEGVPPVRIEVLEVTFLPGFALDFFDFGVPTALAERDFLDAVALNRGRVAPDWTMRTVDGSTLSIADLRGKPVAVFVWVVCSERWFCGPQQDGGAGRLSDVQALADTLGRDVQFVAVAYGSLDSDVAAVLGELNLTVPVALDLGECGNLGGLGYTCEYNPVGGLEYSWNLHQRPLWVLLDEEGRAMTSIREPWTITDLEALIRVLVD